MRELLKNANITQAQLASKLKVKQQTVSAWVNGISKPKITMLPKLAKTLNVTVNDVFNCFR